MNIVITGGAGFIGCNLANRLLKQGQTVIIFDNLSRNGVEHNIAWLRRQHSNLQLIQADIRDHQALSAALQNMDVVYHLAGQTAVTTSVMDPKADFEVNALGTLNVLEAARACNPSPIVIYSSTNKVYGQLEGVEIEQESTRYVHTKNIKGINELQPLDFYSPYGCSKGAADQYVRDYARMYGLHTVVLRQSCIYGPRQLGIEDQGWVAWFIIAAVLGMPITIYGDGRQVRDLLHVDDLLDIFELAVKHINISSGQIYNVGGGFDNALSIWLEFGTLLEDILGKQIEVSFSDWRPGDQPLYISDYTKAMSDLGWQPRINVRDGIKELVNWVIQNPSLFKEFDK